jgi:pimeloyl-ACP methyl ester carboxylesterase
MKNHLTITSRPYGVVMILLFVSLVTTALTSSAQTVRLSSNQWSITYNTVKIDNLDIFYREAGDPNKSTILLLHGFPTSSHMFRNLIPLLANEYHVVAPDYPGCHSAAPSVSEFTYTFDNLAKVIDRFTVVKGLSKYTLYVQDYGAPVGYRLAVKYPDRVQGLIVQNGNAYEEGLRDFWNPLKNYWRNPTGENDEMFWSIALSN